MLVFAFSQTLAHSCYKTPLFPHPSYSLSLSLSLSLVLLLSNMGEPKESQLNQAYYGPSIPATQPDPKPIQSRRRGCQPYCLICTAFKAFTTFLIVIGIIVLILWLIFQPHDLKVYVEDATLARFDLAANGTLYYNLTVDFSVRNPNDKMGVRYTRLEARAFYDGTRFGYKDFNRFYQGKKSTAQVNASFAGQGVVVGDSVAATYSREKGEGFFYVAVNLYTRVKLKIIVVNTVEYAPEVDCYLRIPVPGNATSAAAGFTRTKCDVETFA